jgi:hypothetical protein
METLPGGALGAVDWPNFHPKALPCRRLASRGRRSRSETLGAVRHVTRGHAPARIGSGGRDRGFVGRQLGHGLPNDRGNAHTKLLGPMGQLKCLNRTQKTGPGKLFWYELLV